MYITQSTMSYVVKTNKIHIAKEIKVLYSKSNQDPIAKGTKISYCGSNY